MAHITGGGFPENIPPRVLPDALAAHLDLAVITPPAVFGWLQEKGGVQNTEMLRTFNCGVGMIVVAEPNKADQLMDIFAQAGETPMRLGHLAARDKDAVIYETMINFGLNDGTEQKTHRHSDFRARQQYDGYSGSGKRSRLPAEIALVLSNKPEAKGLQTAADAGIKTAAVDHRGYKGDREAFDAEIQKTLLANDIELVVLAGFMRILTPGLSANGKIG